ncbi:MAG: adenylosuccinate synthase [Candidatus Latescibacterota bacterium]
MSTKVVVGAQWGDEAKAKIVDFLAQKADIVARFQGGANAGHTVIVGDRKIVFHQIPVAAMHPDKICVIGNGVVLDPVGLLEEIEAVEAEGITLDGRLFISPHAHLVMPYHKILDRLIDESKGTGKIGVTGRGIGPCYRDKAARTGIRVGDLLDWGLFQQKLQANLWEKNRMLAALYEHEALEEKPIVEEFLPLGKRITPCVRDVSLFLNRAMAEEKHILFEGAQGTFLDIDHGTYPFVTSSNTTAGGACAGTGVGPTKIDEVIGVVKSYTTRVGSGPLPTEFEGDFQEQMRAKWGEYGATTGRGRRCGWFDAVLVRYSARINGLSSLALTRLDSLDELDSIRVCVAYEARGKRIEDFPWQPGMLAECTPIYEEMAGWKTPTSHVRSMHKLPDRAQDYLRRISELTGPPISLVSVGPERNQTITVA